MWFFIFEALSIVLQMVSFTPFYFIWRKDRKELGEENLVVSLHDRFLTWVVYCPLWIVPILIWAKGV